MRLDSEPSRQQRLSMTEDPYHTIPRKVAALFAAIPQDRIERLLPSEGAGEAMDTIAAAFGDVCDHEIARTIAFNVGNWQGKAALLVAVHLCPERFTFREIREGWGYPFDRSHSPAAPGCPVGRALAARKPPEVRTTTSPAARLWRYGSRVTATGPPWHDPGVAGPIRPPRVLGMEHSLRLNG